MVCLLILGFYEVMCNGLHEGYRVLGNGDVAFEYGLEGIFLAVVCIGVGVVLAYGSAIKIDTCEEALGTRVGQQLGIELPVCGGFAIAANGAGSGGGVCADLELALEQILKTFFIYGNENEIRGLAADLQAP